MAAQDQILNGRYQLLEQRASGGMAIVYKARDLSLSRIVAIKVLRPSLTNDSTFLVRFRQEARNVANLSHPNIVTVYDFGQDASTYYIVMEYVDGQDLKKIIKTSAPLPIDRVLNLVIQICAGVGYAHRAGVVHADVKPQNVLVTADDHVKVTDFGIAQVLSETQPRERQSIVWGSPHYFAPEQAAGEPPTPAADVYAIGIVMFEMLTGKQPYVGVDQQSLALAHMRDPVPHVMDYNPLVPVHLDRIVYKVMAKNPNDRYGTADQLGRVLIGYRQQGSEQTLNQPQPAPGSNKSPVASGNTPPQANSPVIPPPAPQQSAAPAPYAASPTQYATYRPAAPQVVPPPGSAGVPSPTGQPYPTYPAQNAPSAPNYQPAPYSQNPAYPPQQPGQQYGSPQSYPVPGQQYNASHYPAANQPALISSQPGPADNFEPDYGMAGAPSVVDTVTIVLGVIAFLAVIGLFPLWLAVLSAYAR